MTLSPWESRAADLPGQPLQATSGPVSPRAEAGSQALKGLGGTLHQPLHCLIYRQYHKSRGPATTRNVTSFAGMETCSRESGEFSVTLLPPGTGKHKGPGPHGTRQCSAPVACAQHAHRATGPLERPPSALAGPWRGLRTRASAAGHCPALPVAVEARRPSAQCPGCSGQVALRVGARASASGHSHAPGPWGCAVLLDAPTGSSGGRSGRLGAALLDLLSAQMTSQRETRERNHRLPRA